MVDKGGLRAAFLAAADSIEARLAGLSDGFYKNPETGYNEHETSSAMQSFLVEGGFIVEPGVAGLKTAFRAEFGSGAPRIALLAEMDALAGIGHGCGHNIGGTASIGAATALASALASSKEPPAGTIVVFGTPAEELGQGKKDLIRAGLFADIDVAMMVHASSKRTVVKHFLGLSVIRFTFTGRAAHASAYPDEGINALDAVIQTFNSIGALRQQLRGDVRVHGIITDGGRAPNIIPERAEALFYVRAPELSALETLRARVTRCAEGAATATGATLTVTLEGDVTAPMKINAALADAYRRSMAFLGLAEDNKPPDKNVGSSDIGDVSQVVPAIHPHIPIREGIQIHTREFADATATPDGHRALAEGVACLGLTALELLTEPDVLSAVKADFSGGEGGWRPVRPSI